MSKVKATYHIVFGTKNRQQTITPEYRKDLYAYIYGILKQNSCHVHRINGMAEHIHILFDLNPMKALSEVVKSIKQIYKDSAGTSLRIWVSTGGQGYRSKRGMVMA